MGKFIDITGVKFGLLTVVGMSDNHDKSGKIRWVCQCDCGNAKTVVGQYLRCGKAKSCGCLGEKNAELIQLAGQRFGILTVIERTPNESISKWMCRCDCGNDLIAWGQTLRNGKTRSCGCLLAYEKLEKAKLQVPTGTVFGKLTVLSLLPSRLKRWGYDTYCRCECGVEKRVALASLKSGVTKSCGCGMAPPIKHGMSGTPEYGAWTNMKVRCAAGPGEKDYEDYAARGIFVDEQWANMQDGFSLFLQHIGPRPSSKHSLDRIDCNGNYEPGNVQWATKKAQVENRRIKLIENFTDKELLKEACKRGLL